MQKPSFTPWGPVQTMDITAEGIAFVSTASHGGYCLEEPRWAEYQKRQPGFSPRYDGFFEEDCEWGAVAVTFPEHFDDAAILNAVKTCDQWLKGLGLEVPAAVRARAEAFSAELKATGVWERGSCTTRGGDWAVAMRKHGSDERVTVLMRDYPGKHYWSAEEVAGMRKAA